MIIKNWRPHPSGPLVGYVDIYIPSWHATFKDLSFFHNEKGSKWLSFPSKEYTVKGEIKRSYYVVFDADAKERFQKAAVAALEAYFKELE